MSITVYNALIRTHHITSRKKVAVLKAAAKKWDCYALLRSGGIPGVMFVEGKDQASVQQWVDTVHALRYKDYHLVSPVAKSDMLSTSGTLKLGSLDEISTVKEMGALMEQKGLHQWWRIAMGFGSL